MDGVVAVFTGAQLAAVLGPMPIGTPFPSPPHRAIATDVVRYAGEAIAVVVARDRYVARDAIDAITVEYDTLPAVIDLEQAMTGQPAVIHENFPNNLALPQIASGTGVDASGQADDSALERAFAAADVIISQRMHNQRLAPNAMETRGVVAHFEPGKGSLTIWSSTQNPHILRSMIAGMLGLGENQVRAIAPEVGGGFGAKINIYPEEYVAAAVRRSGKLRRMRTCLVPLMKLRLSQPTRLIDIAHVPELRGIRDRGTSIEIGAATVHHDVATSDLIREPCPMLAEAAAEIGDQQVRNRGTLGGSLAHADPSADYPAVILALDATIHLRGPHGTRDVAGSDFFQVLLTVDLRPDELIVRVTFRPAKSSACSKLHQRASHFAIVGVAAALGFSGNSIVSARIGLSGAGTHAVRLTNVEAALTGQALSPATLKTAASLAGTEVADVSADIHASEEYRRAMIPVFTRRALEKARLRA